MAFMRWGSVLPLALAVLLATGAVAEESAQAPPRGGHPACADRAIIIKGLSDKYDEYPIALGIQSTGLLLEIFATSNGSTWSAITTSAQTGQSCIVASGAHWTEVPAPQANTGDGL